VRFLRELCERRSVILGYHGVSPPQQREDPHHHRMPPDRFRAHVEAMLEAGFELLTVAELARRADGHTLPPGLAALSFDDGMEDNHSHLLPILRDYAIPATVYVITGLVGQRNPWMGEGSSARMMTEDELRELAKHGVELGAHTVTHPDMAELDRDACLREMRESRGYLEQLTGAPVTTFAYPFCSYGPAAVAAARECGFEAAVTCMGRGSWDRYEMKRSMLTGRDGLPSFLMKLTEVYHPLLYSPPGRLLRATTRGARARLRSLREPA
jgi:peptidoglycan/xylan/chitin deacetylase (PgdA/CDA1 family)